MQITGRITNPNPAELRTKLGDAFGAGIPLDIVITPSPADLPRDLPSSVVYRVLVHMLVDRHGGYTALCYQDSEGAGVITVNGSIPQDPRATIFLGETATFPPTDDGLAVS